MDFDRWFARQGEQPPAEVEMFPEGVFEMDGKLVATCRSCERTYELPCDVSEFTPDMSYCGGSPWCLP